MVLFYFMDDDKAMVKDAETVSANPRKGIFPQIELGDVATNRILYALALLGVLLPANAIASQYKQIGFTYAVLHSWYGIHPYTWHLHAISFLYIMEGLLAVAVYLYGFNFLFRSRLFLWIATSFFASALIVPPLYVYMDAYSNLMDLANSIRGFWYYVIVFFGNLLGIILVLAAELIVLGRLLEPGDKVHT